LFQQAFEAIAHQRAPVAPTAAAPAPAGLGGGAAGGAAAGGGGAAKAQKAHPNPFKAGGKAHKRQKTAGKASGSKAAVCSKGVSGGAAGGHDGEFSELSFLGASVFELFDRERMQMVVHSKLDVLGCAAAAVARGGDGQFAGGVGLDDLTTLAEVSCGPVQLAAPGSAGEQPLLLPAAPAVVVVGGGGGVGGGDGGQLPKLPSGGGGGGSVSSGGSDASLAVGIAAVQPAVPVVQPPVAPAPAAAAPAAAAAAAAAMPAIVVIFIDSDMEDDVIDLTAGSDSES